MNDERDETVKAFLPFTQTSIVAVATFRSFPCPLPSLTTSVFSLPSFDSFSSFCPPRSVYTRTTQTRILPSWNLEASGRSRPHDSPTNGRLHAAREKHTQERISVSLLRQLCMRSQKLRPMTELFCCYLLEDRFLSIWFLKAI